MAEEIVRARAEEVGAAWEQALETKRFAELLDEKDELKSFRDKFLFPQKKIVMDEVKDLCTGSPEEIEQLASEDSVYLCGNSLGLQPKATRERVLQELDDWHRFGVEGHINSTFPWLTADEFVIKQLAGIVGAEVEEVAPMNSLSANMHFSLLAFYRPTADRFKIVIEAKAFPSDLYGVESQAVLHGYKIEEAVVELKPREGEHTLRTSDIVEYLEKEGDKVAVVMLSGIQYYTGQWFDMKTITEVGHSKGCLVGWDLAHAVGNVPLQLHDWNVDFAFWCHYKYLNSGPGAIGGMFVHKNVSRFQASKKPEEGREGLYKPEEGGARPLAGWWSHDLDTRFQMDAPFHRIDGAFGFRVSNPPILQLAALHSSVDVFDEAKISNLRAKSLVLTAYLELLIDRFLPKEFVTIITPRNPSERGCQLSLLFENVSAELVTKHLHSKGVICDIRKPSVIRIAPTPLYNRFIDVWDAVQALLSAHEKISASSSQL